MKTDDTLVTLTPQLHADLSLAWKLLEDAGHKDAADRVFKLLEQPAIDALVDADTAPDYMAAMDGEHP